MGGSFCVDAQKPSSSNIGFSEQQDFDSLGEYFEDDDSDHRSFISARSSKTREAQIKVRKKTHAPQILNPQPDSWPSYCRPDGARIVLQSRDNPRETGTAADRTSSLPNVSREDSKNNDAVLVVTDEDVKKQIKEIMQPYMQKRVQKIVDQAVEDLFLKVNSTEELSSGSRQSMYCSQKPNSETSAEAVNHSDKQYNKDVENGKIDTIKSEASIASAFSKLPFELTVVEDSFDESSNLPDDSGLNIRRPSSVIRLAKVPTLKHDSSEIENMVANTMATSSSDTDSIDELLVVNHDESGEDVPKFQKAYSNKSTGLKFSSRALSPNAAKKIENEGS